MKKLLGILFVAVATMCVMTSCSTEETATESIYLNVQSKIGRSEIFSMAQNFDELIENNTRADGAVTITEMQAKEIVTPLINDGRKIQTEILEQLKQQMINDPELVSDVENLTDEEAATLSFLCSMTQPVTATDTDMEMTNMSDLQIPWNKVRPCVTAVLGITALNETTAAIVGGGTVEVSGLIPALKFIGKHYLGYIGLAWFVWDTVDCLHENGVI